MAKIFICNNFFHRQVIFNDQAGCLHDNSRKHILKQALYLIGKTGMVCYRNGTLELGLHQIWCCGGNTAFSHLFSLTPTVFLLQRSLQQLVSNTNTYLHMTETEISSTFCLLRSTRRQRFYANVKVRLHCINKFLWLIHLQAQCVN